MRKLRPALFPLPIFLLGIIFLVLPAQAAGETATGLYLGKDSAGRYAGYKLKKNETVWGAVVKRYVESSRQSNRTAGLILKRSGIKDASRIREGAEIKIPLEYLSSDAKKNLVDTKPLHGVVVILDPGHGGIDTGARTRNRVYEDEAVYDIACRLKRKLEEKTAAEVHMTVRDKSRGYSPNHGKSFVFDKDEYVRTKPTYSIRNTTIGLHLRWYLANSIYRKKLRAGTHSSKIIFISIHADSLDRKSRGTMIYYPGRNYCKKGFNGPGPTLRKFAEVREWPNVKFTYSSRVRSETVSKKFSNTVITHLRKNRIKIFNNRPVRDHIQRRSAFAPAVLRYNAVPTKVLIETVNLKNSTDVSRIRQAWFRELYAKALLEALLEYYK